MANSCGHIVYITSALNYAKGQDLPACVVFNSKSDLCPSCRAHTVVLGVQAGGKGSTGVERVLDVCPEQVHQRVPLFIGSKGEVEYLESFL